jgi:hypothetical protein
MSMFVRATPAIVAAAKSVSAQKGKYKTCNRQARLQLLYEVKVLYPGNRVNNAPY